jgi:uncharacterized protein YycO
MIKKTLLRPGDILLFRPKSIFHVSAWFIAWAQNVVGKTPHNVAYCHVALIDENTDNLLEARWPKSHCVPIDWKKLDEAYTIELWRVKEVSQTQIDKAIAWAHANVGEWYDIPAFLWGWFDVKHAEVCSTFVSKSWANAGIEFKQIKKIGDGKLISPDEIAGNTDLIKRIV